MDPTIFQQQVLQRYRFPAIYQINEFNGDSAYLSQSNEIITLLTKCFEDQHAFHSSDFNDIPMDILLDYIRRTHRLYLDKSLQEMEQTIYLLRDAYTVDHPVLDVLNNFYLDYKTELIIHIRQEDDQLLPYIQFLDNSLRGSFDPFRFFNKRLKFNIRHFFENHEENDDALDAVRAKIMSYEPPKVDRFLYNVLLNQLEFFSHDLKIHGLIEDRVVIPRALDMEQRLEKIFWAIAQSN